MKQEDEEKAKVIVEYIYSLEETIRLQNAALKNITDLWQMAENELKKFKK